MHAEKNQSCPGNTENLAVYLEALCLAEDDTTDEKKSDIPDDLKEKIINTYGGKGST